MLGLMTGGLYVIPHCMFFRYRFILKGFVAIWHEQCFGHSIDEMWLMVKESQIPTIHWNCELAMVSVRVHIYSIWTGQGMLMVSVVDECIKKALSLNMLNRMHLEHNCSRQTNDKCFFFFLARHQRHFKLWLCHQKRALQAKAVF